MCRGSWAVVHAGSASCRTLGSRRLAPALPRPAAAACRLDGYSGAVRIDEAEVCESKWVQLGQLRRHAERDPGQYTQVGVCVVGGGGGGRLWVVGVW